MPVRSPNPFLSWTPWEEATHCYQGSWIPSALWSTVNLDSVFLSDVCYPLAIPVTLQSMWALISVLLSKNPRTWKQQTQTHPQAAEWATVFQRSKGRILRVLRKRHKQPLGLLLPYPWFTDTVRRSFFQLLCLDRGSHFHLMILFQFLETTTEAVGLALISWRNVWSEARSTVIMLSWEQVENMESNQSPWSVFLR